MIPKRLFATASLDAVDRYKLMSGLIVPRPIGWIGSRSAAGTDNLAPFSFFNMVAGTPPTVLFVPGLTRRIKDTLANVRETGAFTASVVTEEVAAAMNLTSGEYGPEVDEFDVAGLTKVEGQMVRAPFVAEAKANFECEVSHIHEVGDGPSAAVVFGEVLAIHINEDLLDGTAVDLASLRAVGRLAGSWYSRTGDQFSMERPTG